MLTVPAVRTAVTAAALLVLGAGTLRAQRTTDTTLNVRQGARFSLSSHNGNITVRSWSRNQVRVIAEAEGRGRVDVSETAGGVRVNTSHRGGGDEVEFTITVPVGTAVDIQAQNSDVEVASVCGPVTVNAMNGDISVMCAEGNTELVTLSGDISLANIKGSLDANSTSGDIDLSRAEGRISLQTVSGDISLEQVASNDIVAETVSGEVSYEGRLADAGRYKFASHSGDVSVHLTGTPNATIAVETFSGEFESEFQIQLRPGSRIGKNWEFTLGTGSARMQLSSFSGTIVLRRGGAGGNREE